MTNPVVLTPVSSDVLTSGGVNDIIRVSSTSIEAIVGTTAHANRKLLVVNNTSDISVYWGFASTVTAFDGIEIRSGETTQWAATEGVSIYLVTDKNKNAIVRVAEGA